MSSFNHAYQAYERRVIRGEMDYHPKKSARRTVTHEPLAARIGDLLIQTGLKLKRRYSPGKSMSWSPMTWSKS
jgi:hypothetical protein